MKQSTRRFAVRTCIATLFGGFALCAAGQSIPDQTQVFLERAVKTPTEIIWLRDEILAELWRKNPRLDDSVARCADTGKVKQGCTIGDPSSWRYVFGAGLHDSRFKPLTSGVYLISPQSKKIGLVRAPSGEILLAAGTSVQLIDAAYPGIQLELTAPPDRPLPLGNLASADAGKMFALLARHRGAVSASAASIVESGRVAFKSAGEMQIAVATAIRATPSREVTKPVELRGRIDISRYPAGETVRLIAEAEAKLVNAIIARAQAFREPGPVVAAAAPIPAVAEAPAPPAPIAAVPEPVLETPPVQQEERVAGANPDIARLRAEVEAELARDRERIAAAILPCGKPGASAKQGCSIGPAPRKFVFAGA